MVKKRSRDTLTESKIEAFAGQADTGEKPLTSASVKAPKELARTTISLPAELLEKVEDLAMSNKRSKLPNRTISAIIRAALEKSMK